MRRLAIAAGYALLMCASSVAYACSCMGPYEGLSRWVEMTAADADRIILATVVSVSSKGQSKGAPGPSAIVKVLRSLKGKGPITVVDTTLLCQDFELVAGETRVFFTDKSGMIRGCSNYRPWLTNDGLILELERVLGKRAT